MKIQSNNLGTLGTINYPIFFEKVPAINGRLSFSTQADIARWWYEFANIQNSSVIFRTNLTGGGTVFISIIGY